ncbi:TadE/TadG family type IV pilus assembly protein [Qipengyuania sediminis]|uniref:TadE/TadG family type IV pilus assembly protein n=1 Tax=Qipengyuania sediminis TaxID=1532023 RepID=UPI00105A9DD0|nr:TadE/TadG family type IV pilus assembly protein [Qipengyuania sediminis]
MRGLVARLRQLRADREGATLMEFGFVAPVMILMLMAGFETGYGIYLKTVAAGTLEARARSASLEGATESQFDSEVRRSMMNIMPAYARSNDNITLSKRNYTDYSRIDAPEKITTDVDGDGILDVGDCWLDEDFNDTFGTNEGASGLGGPDDGVFYSVTISFPRMFPMVSMMGLSENVSVTVRTLVINQPFGTQLERPTKCREV